MGFVSEDVEKYGQQSIRYLENALSQLAQGNYDKASELIWGSTAEALKAFAASRGINLRTHRDLWDFVAELSKDLNDRTLYDSFRTASHLHSNFYEVELRAQEVLDALEIIKPFVARLLEMAERKS